jgi:hypothetical protein
MFDVLFYLLHVFLCDRKGRAVRKVKTDQSAVLTVKSGLDPHMISELKDGIQIVGCLWFGGIIL